jgi:hypothetical protein
VDEGPHDDTRAAAIREGYGYEYARDVDGESRDDTRAAAIREGHWREYTRAFPPAGMSDYRRGEEYLSQLEPYSDDREIGRDIRWTPSGIAIAYATEDCEELGRLLRVHPDKEAIVFARWISLYTDAYDTRPLDGDDDTV